MEDAWAKLKEGSVQKFCFMHVDILNLSEIARRNTPRNTKTSLSNFFKEVERHVNSHGGRTWNLTDEEGLFGFYDHKLTKMAERTVASAVNIIDDLKGFNATKSWVRQQIHVRISVHLGDAVYYKKTNLISGNDIRFVARLNKNRVSPDTVSISGSVFQELSTKDGMRKRFRNSGTFGGQQVFVYISKPVAKSTPSRLKARSRASTKPIKRRSRWKIIVLFMVAVFVGGYILGALIDWLKPDLNQALNRYGPALGVGVFMVTVISLTVAVARKGWFKANLSTSTGSADVPSHYKADMPTSTGSADIPLVYKAPIRGDKRVGIPDQGKDSVSDQSEEPQTETDLNVGQLEENATVEPSLEVRRPYRLPADLADFIGREQEMSKMLGLLRQEKMQYNTVVINGIGGVGKSTLAVHVAHRLVDVYPDGQIIVDLCGTSDRPITPVEAMGHVIHSLNGNTSLPDHPNDVAQLYYGLLENKRVLLILDDASGTSRVRPLQLSPPCALIVTSRQTLSLPGARTLRLRDLSVNEARILLKLIASFSRKRITSLNNIARLCSYQPLTLRVIGAYLAANADLTVDKCAQKMLYYIQSLSWENVESVSLEAALRMSVAQLDQEDPELAKHWRMLTVFPESFDRTATAAVWKAGEREARYNLDAIVKRGLLLYDPEKDRYRLHRSVHPVARYFINGKKRNSDPAQEPNFLVEAAARHAEHYETVLRMADQLYQHGDEGLWRGLEQFDFEWRNIQVGQAWAENHSKENDTAAELCSAYADAGVNLLGLRQHPTEQISWFEAAVTAARRLNNPGGEIAHLGYMASLYSDLGETRRAIELYQRRLEIARDIGNLQDESKTMSDLGLAYATLGETNRAIEIYEQALAIDREMNNRQGEGAILANLGNAYSASGEFHRAVEVYEQALAIASELGDRRGDGETLSNMGYAHATFGQASQAIKFYEQSLPLLRESGDRFREGNTLGNLGNACYASGEYPRAVEFYERALVIARETGDREGEGVVLRDLGNAYIALGKSRQAIMCSEQCLTILNEISGSLGKGKETKDPGLTYFVLGEPSRTIEFSKKCLSILRESGDRRGEARALFTMSLVVDGLGNRTEAIAQAEAALKIYEGTRSPDANMVRKQLDRWRQKK